MKPVLLTLALLCTTSLPALQDSPDTVREASSEVEYALTLDGEALSKDVPAASGGQPTRVPSMKLLGTGLRTKTWFDIHVYAVGLYIDAGPGLSALGAWRGESAKALAQDEKLYARLLEGKQALTLRLVMCRDVDGDDMAEAFDDALGPRMKRAVEEDELRGSLEDLGVFRSYFKVDEVKDEVELLFTWLPDGRLLSRMEGKFLGAIDSPALCRSLFDVYLGADPIQKKIKRDLIAYLPGLLNTSAGK